MTIENLWNRLETWAKNNEPALLDELQGPASQDEISELEKRLNLSLPDEFKKSLLIHNGEDDGWPARVFCEYGAYLSVPEIYNSWKSNNLSTKYFPPLTVDDVEEMDDFDTRIKPINFSDKWVPIMDLNGDVLWMLDFDPAPSGKNGQVIVVDREEYASYNVIADSFLEFLQNYVNKLESGKIEVDLERSSPSNSNKKYDGTNLDDYFEDDGANEFQNYQEQCAYIEKIPGISDLDDEYDFNHGDIITLYGAIEPNYETNQHKLSAFYVGKIIINGKLQLPSNKKRHYPYHVYAVKLKVDASKGFIFKTRKYEILGYEEIKP